MFGCNHEIGQTDRRTDEMLNPRPKTETLLGQLLIRQKLHLGVLLQQLGEVLEERVLRSEKVKLVVALLSVHQTRQELTAVTSYELCC